MSGPVQRALEGVIRPGRRSDREAVRSLTIEGFSEFGEYGSWLPEYLANPGVWTWVWEVGGEVVGFAMLGLIEAESPWDPPTADLLAIAVRSGWRGRGGGSALLRRVIEKAGHLHATHGLREIRLTVAETNEGARRVFRQHGFEPVAGDHGHYSKGQRALRLRRPL